MATFSLILVACSGGVSEETSTSPTEAPATTSADSTDTTETTVSTTTGDSSDERYGGTLRMALHAEPQSIDPYQAQGVHEAAVMRNIYDPVLIANPHDYTYDNDPQVLEEWGPSDDGLAWTFKLRDGVQFHDGSAATAEDLKFTFEENIRQGTRAAELLSLVDEIRVVDDLTVEFSLRAPDRMIELALTFMFLTKNDPNADLNVNPMGTGPFEFVEWTPGNEIVLERNDNYWLPEFPYLDGVQVIWIGDDTARAAALQSDEFDLDPKVPITGAGGLEDAGIELTRAPNDLPTGYWGFFIDTREEPGNPWADKRVRQALSYSIDREAISEALLGFMLPTANPMFSVFEEFQVDDAPTYDYDPERGRQLLEEAGYPDGIQHDLWFISGGEYDPMAAIIQASAAEAGFEFTLQQADVATWRDVVISRSVPGYVALNAGVPSADPYDNVIHIFDKVHGEWAGWPEHSDGGQEFYAMVESARSITDDAEWVEMVQNMLRHGMEYQPFVVIGGRLLPMATQPRVENFLPRVRSEVFLRDVWLSEE